MRAFKIGGKALCVSIFGLDQVLKLCHQYTIVAINSDSTITIELEDGIECTLSQHRFIPVVE